MSRSAFPPSGPPGRSLRGIPRASQNPDPPWFGRRAQGERREVAEAALQEAMNVHALSGFSTGGPIETTQIDENSAGGIIFNYAQGRIVLVDEPYREPVTRKTKEAIVTVNEAYGGRMHAHININSDSLNISPEELANTLADVMAKVAVRKREPRQLCTRVHES